MFPHILPYFVFYLHLLCVGSQFFDDAVRSRKEKKQIEDGVKNDSAKRRYFSNRSQMQDQSKC